MDREEYMFVQNQLLQIGTLATQLNISGFLDAISRSEAVAPIIDPTLYMKGCDNLSALKKLAQAFANVQFAHSELQQAVIRTQMRDGAAYDN